MSAETNDVAVTDDQRTSVAAWQALSDADKDDALSCLESMNPEKWPPHRRKAWLLLLAFAGPRRTP
jgi:hypothetical protein